MSRCLYGRCLLLSHPSYLVVLLPYPMVLSLVPLLGQCGLWYSFYCRIARCRIHLFVIWSYLDHGFLYPACPGVWSVCLGLASAFIGLSSGSLMPWSFLVWSLNWLYFLMSSLAFFLMVLHISAYSIRCLLSLFSAISRRFVTSARVGDDILDFSGLLIVLAIH